MKLHYIAAATLLFSTSALAWQADDSKPTVSAEKVSADAKLASVETDKSIDMSAKASGEAKLQTASWDPAAAKTEAVGDKIQLASSENFDAKRSMLSQAKVQMASADTWTHKTPEPVQTAFYDDWAGAKARAETMQGDNAEAYTGMGGPLEEVDGSASVDTSTRVAAANYPPCDPGPGDDNCIQLYEPGVRAELASWNQSTGGSAATAMGGPYEPVETDLAMNAEADTGLALTTEPDPAIADHSRYGGVGGPIEAQSGYPPCDPGPGDDRCIQLYEPGVTGAGN